MTLSAIFAPLLAVTIVAHDPGYMTSISRHLQRWLQSERIASALTTPTGMAGALAKDRIAFLVGFSKPSPGEMATLRAFRRRGGKLVVFYSAAPELASLVGVKPLGYAAAPYPGAWSRMDFVSRSPDGLPAAIRQTSTVLMRAAPLPGRGRVLATWSDRRGKATGDAAWIATDAGYWMTHVLLADGDENLKAQLLGAIVGSAVPGSWSVTAHRARAAAQAEQLRAYASAQVPRKGEIHAVWDHSGCGLHPGDWPRTMRKLAAARVTDVFVNVAGAGFAHYASNVLPRSRTFREEGDQLAACLAAARGTGIRVHAWVLAFSATRSSPEFLAICAKRGWRLKDSGGRLTEYLDPANPAVRAHVIAAIDEIQARYQVAGIHLDFVRYGDSAVKPKGAAGVVTRFVAEVRRHVKRPRWLTAAVYGRYPNCMQSVGQDWCGWLDAGLVDYAVPMDYTESAADFAELVGGPAAVPSRARRIVAGLGITANESRLDARKAIEQIRISRKYGLAGNALFDLDVTLENQILPYLKLGVW